jgi:hypothetical protein
LNPQNVISTLLAIQFSFNLLEIKTAEYEPIRWIRIDENSQAFTIFTPEKRKIECKIPCKK